MKQKLKLVKVDIEYCNYLRKFDNKVPYNSGNKKSRPFVGILFTVNKYFYFAPLSSPRPKHLTLRNQIDFLRIKSGELGAVNFNNMIPVFEQNITEINLDLSEKTDKNEKSYKKLLLKQLQWLTRNKDTVYALSKNLYNSYVNGDLYNNVRNRCCNFLLLEEIGRDYASLKKI